MIVDMLEEPKEIDCRLRQYNDYHNIHCVIDKLNSKNCDHSMKCLEDRDESFFLFLSQPLWNTYIDIDDPFVRIVHHWNMVSWHKYRHTEEK